MTIFKDWMAEKETANCHYFGSNRFTDWPSRRERSKGGLEKDKYKHEVAKELSSFRVAKNTWDSITCNSSEINIYGVGKSLFFFFFGLINGLLRISWKGFQLVRLDINHQRVLSVTIISIQSCNANGIQALFTDTLRVFKIYTGKLTHIAWPRSNETANFWKMKAGRAGGN